MCDDFGYVCQKCSELHCPNCLPTFDEPCGKCTEVSVQKECLFCKVSPIKARSIHDHHVNWVRFGFPKNGYTIKLCSNHHHKLHAWIEHEAIKFCINSDSKFFKNKTEEYLKKLMIETGQEKEIIKNQETHVGESYAS
jgi:hypothetical protein